MPLSNYAELRDAVLRTLDAEQDVERQAMVPVWTSLASSDIMNSLRAGWMIRQAEAVIGQATDTDPGEMTLPPSLVELAGISFVDHGLTDAELAEWTATGRVAALATNTGQPLEALGPEHLYEVSRRYGTTPRGYVVEGHRLRLVPWNTTNRPLLTRFTYYSRGSDLVEDDDSNEILHHVPAAYYYGVLRHAAIFAGDMEGEQRWSSALLTTVQQANASSYGWQGTGIVSRRVRA
jgi:hypothetical protein